MTTKRFWKLGFASFTIIFVLVLSASVVQAQTSWTVPISIKNSDPIRPMSTNVSFGVNPNAIDGLDDLDVIIVGGIPPAPSPGQPFLNAGFAGPGLSYFSKDIRPAGPWTLFVASSGTLTISWDASSVPVDIPLSMVSSDGKTIDMKATASAVFETGSYSMDIKVPMPPAQITVEPTTGGRDIDLTVEGINFGANEQVTVDFGNTIPITTVTSGANGSLNATFVATPQQNGSVMITATGVTSGQQAKNSTFIYSGPQITSVNVAGSPAATIGETIIVTLKGESKGVANFSIEGVTTNLPMDEISDGVYTGKYVIEPDVTVENAVVTVTLKDIAGNLSENTEYTVTISPYVEFTLSLNTGINLISVPLDTKDTEEPINKVSDLMTILGDSVSIIISYNIDEKKFQSFTSNTPKDSPLNVDIGPSTGLIVVMKEAKEIVLRGNGWQSGAVDLMMGINLISIPVNDPTLETVSDLATIVGDEVSLIMSYNMAQGKFQSFTSTTKPGTPADVAIMGGESFIIVMKNAADINVGGEPWKNLSPPPLPAPMMFNSTTSPVLELDGIVTREDAGEVVNDLSVTVYHFSTGATITDTTSDGNFSFTFVYLDNHFAHVGDILEITAYNSSGNFKIDPIRYALTESDIELGRVSLGNLVASAVPIRSELLANFPNPFNPETWIPFKLQKSSDISITIYDVHGRVVRQLELGSIPAGTYQTKAKAAYWDGTNDMGERVASGVYFYHLKAGEFSASRKMAILK